MKNTATVTTIKPASLGSISAGTLRTEDLLSSFADELETQIFRNGFYFSLPENRNERDKLNSLHGEALDCFSEDGSEIADGKEDEASEIVNDIQDALGQFAPPYSYFGAHCGDGSDFGYWPSMEEIDELPTVADSDGARELGEDAKSVNDHGNVTIYGGDGSVLLELV